MALGNLRYPELKLDAKQDVAGVKEEMTRAWNELIRTLEHGDSLVANANTDAVDEGVKKMNDLSDADTETTTPSTDDFLSWDGTNWVPVELPEVPEAPDSNPVGSVLIFPTTTAVPSNYLELDGSSFDELTYPDLFTALDDSNVLPDWRGEFLRSWDNGRGIDSGRTLGTAQGDELEAHEHFTMADSGGSGGAISDFVARSRGTGNDESYSIRFVTSPSPTAGKSSTVGGTETRPRNISVIYAIKASA